MRRAQVGWVTSVEHDSGVPAQVAAAEQPLAVARTRADVSDSHGAALPLPRP